MKGKLFIIFGVGLMIAMLVALNALTYVQKEEIPDSEVFPNRSTYSTGPTGTRAFHDLLVSTGQSVKRWEEPMIKLNDENSEYVSTLVIFGKTRRAIEPDEIKQILEWVDYGGNLVIVDRAPPAELLETTSGWKIGVKESDGDLTQKQLELLLPTVDPSNSKQMTDGAPAAKPVQPTIYSSGINAIQPSKFASSISIIRVAGIEKSPVMRTDAPSNSASPPPPLPPPARSETREENKPGTGFGSGPGISAPENDEPFIRHDETNSPANNGNTRSIPSADSNAVIPPEEIIGEDEPPQDVADLVIKNSSGEADEENEIEFAGPLVHFGNEEKDIVVEFPYGSGRVIFLSDPYILSNGGVRLVDNAQLGLNVISNGGLIAFDEYHQGYGRGQNRLISYFSGTPLIPVLFQLLLIGALIMYSRSRRFARAIPVDEPNRISQLEYVSAMAQLKRRTKAFDLAIENIYTDFRRRVSRLIGVDNASTKNRDIAREIGVRTDYEDADIEELMAACEDIVHGQATSKKEVLKLAMKIREVENALGLRRGRTAMRK